MSAPTSDNAVPDWSGRLRGVREYCARQGLDAYVSSSSHNLAYLCGFNGTAGLLITTEAGGSIISSWTAGMSRSPRT